MKALLSLVGALIGGAVVAVAFVATGAVDTDDSGNTETIIRQSPIAKGTTPARGSTGLTAGQIYKNDAPGVVFIEAQVAQSSESPFDPFGGQQGQATGTGFVIDADGNILTNAHVVEGASKVSVKLSESKTIPAQVVGKDPSVDLALVKVDPSDLDVRPLELGDSDNVQVGDPTVAIGNPFGLDRTLTTGVVSAKQREIPAPNGFRISDVIQTDAAINPGNSGGPLIDAAGRVIGVNSQIQSTSGGNVGIGFAVPINTAKKIIPQLRDGDVERAYLGITGATIDDLPDGLNLEADKGVLVQEATPDGPAAKAGVKGGESQIGDISLGGDVITKVDGRPVDSMEDVVGAVDAKKPGDEMTVTVMRDGKEQDVDVTLGERPDSAPTQ